MLDLANKLISRGLNVTVLVTPSTLPLLNSSTENQSTHHPNSLQSLVLPFPQVSGPSVSVAARIRATGELYGPILEWFQSHPSPPLAIISDFFLGWTHKLACQLNIPRLVFWPSGALPSLLLSLMWRNISDYVNVTDENTLFSFPDIPNSPVYPYWQIASLSSQFKKGDPIWEFIRDGLLINNESWGAVFNSFRELEAIYLDTVKKEMGHERVWAVGPLLPSKDDFLGSYKRGGSSVVPPHEVLTWLDDKVAASVVYVCFGSLAVLTSDQLRCLATALECSGVHFVWCVKEAECGQIPEGYEDRVVDRGFLIKGWAPQVAILRHPAVGAFLSHCGWNSSLEGLANEVMILTWPIDADQFLGARFLVDEIGVAIKACEGGNQTIPDPKKLSEIFAESVKRDHPKRDKVRELCDAATKAVEDEGSSSQDLDALVQKLNELKSMNYNS